MNTEKEKNMEAQMETQAPVASTGPVASRAPSDFTAAHRAASLFDIPFRKADGTATTLDEHAGKVMLIVNVASKCGLTGQYDGLVALHEKYKERGFTVLGFPSNDFAGQEPGSDEEIQQFCR